MIRILFVCHGNICRSVAAEFIAKKIIRERGLERLIEVESRAVSYEEIGNDIYPPMKQALKRADIPFSRHYAAIITDADVKTFDEIYYMDESNRRFLRRMFGEQSHFYPVMRYDPDIDEIEDPWYSGRYDLVLTQLSRCLTHILDHIQERC